MNENPSKKRITELEIEIERLKEELHRLKSLPIYEGYLADLIQIEFWNKELQDTPTSIKSGSEEDYRAFDKALNYLKTKPTLYKNLEDTIIRMSPNDVEKAKQASTSSVDNIRKKIKNELQAGAEATN